VQADHKRIFVIMSVDWEPNHGPWDRGGETDYGGILKGTPALESLLDSRNVPCTWFIEASAEADRNLPALFPGVVERLAARKRDEIGLHVHWRRALGPRHTILYETSDRVWTREQIAHGALQLRSCGIRPSAFRSGALLYVAGLPEILEAESFTVDSSTLAGDANQLIESEQVIQRRSTFHRISSVAKRLCSPARQPYFADLEDVRKAGEARVLEFPISAGILQPRGVVHSLLRRVAVLWAGLDAHSTFLTFFFHIDEMLDPRSGPNEKAEPDGSSIRLIADMIEGLQSRGDIEFLSIGDGRRKFAEIED
jgi:hypothetical protein